MQINGLKEFATNFTASLQNTGQQSQNAITGSLHSYTNTDTFTFSDLGKRLSAKFDAAIMTNVDFVDGVRDPHLRLLDKYMKRAEEILTDMYVLAVGVQQKDLTDSKRIEMQIAVEDFKDELTVMATSLRSESRGGQRYGTWTEYLNTINRSAGIPEPENDSWGARWWGDHSSLLERVHRRIANGEKWNVREAWLPYGFSNVTYNDEGKQVIEATEGGSWHVVDDSTPGMKPPTVMEKLERQTTTLLMDPKSAEKAATHLKQQIERVQDWRRQLEEFVVEQQSQGKPGSTFGKIPPSFESAYAILKGIEKNMGPSGIPPLLNADVPDYFLSEDGVHDERYALNIKYGNHDGTGDISLSDTGKPENDTAANYNGYVLDVLTDVDLEVMRQNELAFLEHQPEVVYIKGLNGYTR